MKTHTVCGAGGVELRVDETGNPHGKSILFIHGFSQCRQVWSKQMRSDLASDFRLLAMDIRGHGSSEKPPGVYGDPKLWAADLHSVIATLDLDRPVLSGWSYAGVIMTDYVDRFGESEIAGTNWVGAISRLGDPLLHAGFVPPEVLVDFLASFSDSVSVCGPALERIIRLYFRDPPSPDDLYFLLGCSVLVPPHVREAMFTRNVDNDRVVRALEKPMLLSYGEQDRIVPTMSRHIAGLASHAQLSLYPDAGHAPFWEAPQRFNRELRAFRRAT